jgi:hypothetical protein
MSSDLIALAREYVALSDQLEAVRAKIKATVLNGSAPDAKAEPALPFSKPTAGRRKPPKTPHPNAKLAAEAEAKIIEVIRTQPGIKTAEIARAMDAKANTTAQRMGRMVGRNLVQRDDQGGYALPA